MSYVSSVFASKNNPTKKGSGEMWQEQAKALFFMEKKSIQEISKIILKSKKSIYSYFKKLPEYKQEKENRKISNGKKRKEYQRQWDRQNRSDRYTNINEESMKREHDIAAMILSRERH
ncbi:hypothetical protein AAK894_14280 [Lachnospiraceae bacterium 46-61]